ncbi:MAG: hypothetical protein ACOYPS_10420 [Phycisphaerales bacterium]|jgi:hypothetical protein
MKKNLALALMAGAALALPAAADVTFTLASDQDLSVLCQAANPAFYVGNNPSVISLVGDRLFVAGYRATSGTGVAATGQLVVVENIFGARAFRAVPSSLTTLPATRGFYGLQYDHGPARAGLLLSYDAGGAGQENAFRLYDVDSQINPVLVAGSPLGLSARGGAGPAFDYGANGLGFDYAAAGVGTGVGPVMAMLDFADYGGVQVKGPFGIALSGPYALDALQGALYNGDSVNASGQSIAPIVNTFDASGVRISGTLWRDISVDPRNGNLAVRASNDLVVARRNANNGVSSLKVVSCAAGSACDDIPFQILQRCEMLYGQSTGDVVIFNQYVSAAVATNPFATWVKAVDLDGAAVTLSFKNPDGSDFVPAASQGIYDFSWDPTNSRLAICDFANRRAYIFDVGAPNPCGCAADYNQDGGVDGGDIESFFADWEASGGCSDVNQDGGVDGSDIESFFQVWEAGGC